MRRIVVRRYKIKEKKLGWNKTNLKLIFLRTDFRSKLIQIKISFKIFKYLSNNVYCKPDPLYLVI